MLLPYQTHLLMISHLNETPSELLANFITASNSSFIYCFINFEGITSIEEGKKHDTFVINLNDPTNGAPLMLIIARFDPQFLRNALMPMVHVL